MQTYNLYSWHRPCWKCERSTPRVIATNPEYEFNAMDVDDDLGKAMGKRFDYFSKKRGRWENWCVHCDALQGDFYVQTEEWLVEMGSQAESVQSMVDSGQIVDEGTVSVGQVETHKRIKFADHPVDLVVEANRTCFKCEKATPVIFTVDPYSEEVREPNEASSLVLSKRFPFWKKSMNKTQKKEVWSNHCSHCGMIQGNGFVKAVVEEALDSAANNLYIARDQGSLLLHDSVHVKHVDPHIEQGYCGLCAKKLQPIKNQRRNGGMGSDWKSRRLHITCWRKLNESGF